MKTLTVTRRYAGIAQKVINDTTCLKNRLEQVNAITWSCSDADDDIEMDIQDNFDIAGIPEVEYVFE